MSCLGGHYFKPIGSKPGKDSHGAWCMSLGRFVKAGAVCCMGPWRPLQHEDMHMHAVPAVTRQTQQGDPRAACDMLVGFYYRLRRS